MAKRKSGGGAAGIGGAAAIVCALLALSGNLGPTLDRLADQVPSQGQSSGSGDSRSSDRDSTGDSGAKISDAGGAEVAVPSSVTAPTAAQARDLLTGLTSTGRVKNKDSTYKRDDYGAAWADVDGNGCSQRQDVLHVWLVKDAPKDVRTKGSCDHEVYAGTWDDPYTGRSITLTDAKSPRQSQTLQIDHIVPLKEAHDSGAGDWTSDQKSQFANDTINLVPVYGPANMSKGAQDAASWRPRKQYQCDYARRYTAVKAKWNLSVDDSERAALADMLNVCK